MGVPLLKDHMELVWGLLSQGIKAPQYARSITHLVKQDPGDHQAPHHQQDHLNNVGECHCTQPAIKRISHRKNTQCDQTHGEIDTGHGVDGQCA